MDALCFGPTQSPVRTRFSNNEFITTSSSAVTCSRRKSLIYPTLSKQGAEISRPVHEVPPLSAPASVPLLRVSPSSLQCESGYLLRNENLGGGAVVANGTLNAMEYLTNILASKVYDLAYESPMQLATKLSVRWGVNVWLKREDLQPVCISFGSYMCYQFM